MMTKKHILNISLTLSHFKSFYYKIKSLENDCIFYASPTLPPLFFFNFWICRYGIRPENVIIYGQSIGTVPSVDLAARYESAAVILHSPLTSGMRVAFPDTKKTYCFDAFPK